MGQFDFVQFFLLKNLIEGLVEEFDHLLHIYIFTNNDERFVGCLVYLREMSHTIREGGESGLNAQDIFFAIWITVFTRIFINPTLG